MLHLWLNRLGHLPSDAFFAAIREIGHVSRHGREIANIHRSIGLLARSDAVDEVLHVILVASIAHLRRPILAVCLLWKVASCRVGLAGHHVLFASDVLDGSIAAKEVLTKSVAAVAESRLPAHDEILREIE